MQTKFKVIDSFKNTDGKWKKNEHEFDTLESAKKWVNAAGLYFESNNPEWRADIGLLEVKLYKHRGDLMPAETMEIQEIN